MRKTYKIKLYRSKKNKHLNHTIDLAGRAFNHVIALHKKYYALTGNHLSQYDLMRHFTKLKKLPEWAWLKEIPSQALQDIIQRIEKGYQLFFKSVKGEIGFKVFPPSFRKVVKYKSFTLKVAGWGWSGHRKLRVGKCIYKLVNDQMPQGDIKTVTIKRDPLGDLWACFSVEQDILLPVPTSGNIAGSAIIGVDFGLKTFLIIHDGQVTYPIESPLFFKQSMNRLKKLNRALSRKKKGSNNRKRAKYARAREYKRIADRRRNWFFKLAHQLTDLYSVLVFEDLNLKGMVKLWGRKVTDIAFGEFLQILQYIAAQKGCVVHLVDRFFPSSKRCHGCRAINSELTLSDRRWRCQSCGNLNDRDENAAMNIRSQGIETLSLVSVRPLSEAAYV